MTLVELIVAMSIMLVISTMIVISWISLSKAYSFTSRNDRQRDVANVAIARMAREIRDAQQPAGSTSGAFVKAYPNEIDFYSTFNMAGNSDPTMTPRLTRFILRETDPVEHVGAIYREIAGTGGSFAAADAVSTVLATDVVNPRQIGADLFTYSAISTTTGQMYQSSGMATLVPPSRLQTVRILVLVDLNPGKSPNYMDISTTVEPRNVRHL
jgi:type II secretory pathway pseudopilin PulG